MNPKRVCKHYKYCAAPLCTILDVETNKNINWYPNEEVCRRVHKIPPWLRRQKKIAKKASPQNYGYYFTIEMLEVNFRVTNKVKGIDPDRLLELELRKWHKRFKGRKPRSAQSEKTADKKRAALQIARKLRSERRQLTAGI